MTNGKKALQLLVRGLLIFTLIAGFLTSCSGASDAPKQTEPKKTDVIPKPQTSVATPKPSVRIPTPLEEFDAIKEDVEEELQTAIYFGLTEDSVDKLRSARVNVDSDFDMVQISLDLAIEVYRDFEPELGFCKNISQFALKQIFRTYRKFEFTRYTWSNPYRDFYLNRPKTGYSLELVWNGYYRKVDEFGQEDYVLKRNYGRDKVWISTNNWDKIVYDENYNTEANFFKLSDLERVTENKYPRCEYN